jgi:hypothetical protein
MSLRKVVCGGAVALVMLAVSGAAWAQQGTSQAAQDGPRTAAAAHTDEPIVIDGEFKEAAWASAKPVTQFLQKELAHEDAHGGSRRNLRLATAEEMVAG